jgi:hypothetical protein
LQKSLIFTPLYKIPFSVASNLILGLPSLQVAMVIELVEMLRIKHLQQRKKV